MVWHHDMLAAAIVWLPLDAEAAIDAILANGLGELIRFIIIAAVYLLIVGVIVSIIAAGLSRMSIKSTGQKQFADYFVDAMVILVVIVLVAAMPEILSALGFTPADNLSAIDIFSG